MSAGEQPRATAVGVDWTLVTRVVDRLIPEDDYPSASQSGVVARLASGSAAENRALWADLLAPGFAALSRELSCVQPAPDLPQKAHCRRGSKKS